MLGVGFAEVCVLTGDLEPSEKNNLPSALKTWEGWGSRSQGIMLRAGPNHVKEPCHALSFGQSSQKILLSVDTSNPGLSRVRCQATASTAPWGVFRGRSVFCTGEEGGCRAHLSSEYNKK